MPVQPLTVKVSLPVPPVSFAIPNPDSVRVIIGVMPLSATNCRSDSVKFAARLDTTVSVPPPPRSTPVPFQPLTVKTLLPTPPLSSAAPMLDRVTAPKPGAASDVVVNVMSTFRVAAILLVPVPPVSVAVAVQSLTSKRSAPLPPVSFALVNPLSTRFMPSVVCKFVLDNVKWKDDFASDVLVTTRVSGLLPLTPVKVPVPVQPLAVKVFAEVPPVSEATCRLAKTSVPRPVKLVLVSVKLTLPDSTNVLIPKPPSNESLPKSPLTVSSPPRASSRLLNLLPVKESLPEPPITFSKRSGMRVRLRFAWTARVVWATPTRLTVKGTSDGKALKSN